MNKYIKLMRLDKPIGIWLLLFPCLFSIFLASPNINFKLITIFTAGAIIMRSAGCIINDMWDRKIDANIERTKNRPLASGKISLKFAFILLGILLSIGLGILVTLPLITIKLGIAFLIPVIIYPLMKRFIAIPQLFLGITFNAGAIMGWSAVTGDFPPLQAWILYLACFFWTIGYDTIYAYQDKIDDASTGVKSSALIFGDQGKLYIGLCYILFITILLVIVRNWIFFILLIPASLYLFWQIYKVNLNNPMDSMAKFKSNLWAGLLIMLAIIINNYISHSIIIGT